MAPTATLPAGNPPVRPNQSLEPGKPAPSVKILREADAQLPERKRKIAPSAVPPEANKKKKKKDKTKKNPLPLEHAGDEVRALEALAAHRQDKQGPSKGKPAPPAKSLREADAHAPEHQRKIPTSADPAETNKKDEKAISPLVETKKNPLPTEHAWTPGDEVWILEAMAAHRQAEQNKLPTSIELFASLDGRLESKGFSRQQLRRKVRSLKCRHDGDAVKGGVPAEQHERRLYHLSKNVWDAIPVATNGGDANASIASTAEVVAVEPNVCQGGVPAEEHERCLYHLSKNVWDTIPEPVATSGGGDANVSIASTVAAAAVVPNVCKGCVKGGVPAEEHERRLYHLSKNVSDTIPEPVATNSGDANASTAAAAAAVPNACNTFDEMRQLYPCLAHEAVHIVDEPAVLEKLLLGINDSKARALNSKINDLREELAEAITESAKMQNIEVPKRWQCPAKSRAANASFLYSDRVNKLLGMNAAAQEQMARTKRELVRLNQDIIASGPPKDIRCESAESAPQSVVAEKQFSNNVKERKIPAREKLARGNNNEVTSKYRRPQNLSRKMVWALRRMHHARKEKLDAGSQILHDADQRKVAGCALQGLSHHINVQGGKQVILLSCVRPHHPVAMATLETCSPSTIVGDRALGTECCWSIKCWMEMLL